jgi:hypothetical protein
MIHGIASTPSINSHKYALLSRGCRAKLPVPVLSAHSPHGKVGQVIFLRKSATQIYVRCTIYENEAGDYAWRLIERGELSAFSGAADFATAHLQAEIEGVKFYDSWRLQEVSMSEGGEPRLLVRNLRRRHAMKRKAKKAASVWSRRARRALGPCAGQFVRKLEAEQWDRSAGHRRRVERPRQSTDQPSTIQKCCGFLHAKPTHPHRQ